LCKPWVLQRLDLHMYVDVILFVMCEEHQTICNLYINLTLTMFGSCFTCCLLEGTCLIYLDCVCVFIVVSNIHCVVFCFVVFRKKLAQIMIVKRQNDKQLSSRIYKVKLPPSPLKLVVTVLKWNNIRLVCQSTLARLLCLAENVGVQMQFGKKVSLL
jgi:hypothetical protein